ncbi:MAG TPA: sugar ABC transporter ATP-binding protein [Trebonia sp.]
MVEQPDEKTTVLEVRNISKTFGATRALRHVDFSIDEGEVFAVLGQNGSGKSTLVKILSGFHEPDPGGEIIFDGEPLPIPLPPGIARERGMGFVYQDLGLVPGMTVLENLTIAGRSANRGTRNFSPISWRRERLQARKMLERYGLSLDPSLRVFELPLIDRALLAIARAAEELEEFRARTGRRRSLLVLDEPTVFLSGGELTFLFDLIKIVTANGASVMFISHDLEAVRAVSSRFVVLRDGAVAGTGNVADTTEDQMIDMIVGSARERFERSALNSAEAAGTGGRASALTGALAGSAAEAAAVSGGRVRDKELLAVEGLAGGTVRELSFRVNEGEIIGLAGVTGSGTEDAPYLLFGGSTDGSVASAGTIKVGGRQYSAKSMTSAQAMSAGLALVPANRPRDGAVANLSIADNIFMLTYASYFSRGMMTRRTMMAAARDRTDLYDIRPPDPARMVSQLSGGNQQKTVLAKWMESRPRILLLHEPTQGVDVGARAEIRALVKDACLDRGMGVVWVGTDFEELAEMCDHVFVLASGRVVKHIPRDELTKSAIDEAVLRTASKG